MTDWKPLPDDLASDVRQLVTELRTLKIRSGVSLAALAERTPYSKSSWERYLNGKTLPPRQAVTILGKLSDAEPARLEALWELANAAAHDQQAGGGRPAQRAPQPATPADATEVASAPSDEGRRRRRDARLLWTAALLLALLLVGTAVVLVNRDSSAGTARAAISATEPGTRQVDVNCFADSCAGKDPKEAGCGGDAWTAALTKVQQVYVELRYSDACRAAWARISWGRPGDIARIVGPRHSVHQNKVHYDTDTYSAMLAAPTPSAVKACAVLTSGRHGCTGPGGDQRLTEPPNPPAPTLSPTG
ncbi:DUF2690 domain-containing protein [Streptomyces sp. 5-8]|uniref:DUF2690 domain-containing protein n=1 Tax=Streptomyces musisoli TaxID=2802280 RepID=A0ABS1PDQ9_9ACTN|nr:XRE family transcriptional regulator [Streptomyces musisoli]MBL1110170.1 DUF2690 domain-containing protein [Streptomyces musisoli]